MISPHVNSLLQSKRVLLLQGPLGGFFSKFSQWLNTQGIQTFKINFNGGDAFFSKNIERCFSYTDSPQNYSKWIEQFILNHEIDAVVCFGDCRYYHRVTKTITKKNRIKFFAFEEGYIRPNFITFEEDGVNFYSNFLHHIQEKKELDQQQKIQEIKDVNSSYYLMVGCAITYYLFMLLGSFKYSKYQHHRMLKIWQEVLYWCLSAFRRVKNHFIEVSKFENFIKRHKQEYFVFALQVHNDFQIRTHSQLGCVRKYIGVVIQDFALNAHSHHHLVLKHHAMDRGYRHYGNEIQRLAKLYGVEGRIHYFCDVHLPTLLKNGLGFVTINSTTGIQALYHGIPTKALGYALYNLPKLTYNYRLANFWVNPGKVDTEYFQKFRIELIGYSQLNGSFYGSSPWMSEVILNKSQDKAHQLKKDLLKM